MKTLNLAQVPDSCVETCLHCGTRSSQSIKWETHFFCCNGCLAVYQILGQQGLKKFYDLRESVGGGGAQARVADIELTDFKYADSDAFKTQYAYGASQQAIDVYVEGVHCAACIWLLEKLPQYVPSVKTARLNMGDSLLSLTVENGHFSLALDQIQKWGYKPRPIKTSLDQRHFREQEYRKDLARLSVAAFCAGNIMLLSVCLYAGIGGALKEYFEWASLLLALPSLFYSALPLYKSSWMSLKRLRISIDLPISVAMATAFTVSVHSLLTSGPTYFDSVTALVFLILSSRFFLKRIQQKHLNVSRLQTFLDVSQARKKVDEEFQLISAESILENDYLRVEAGEMIPVDGEVVAGEGYMNTSLINGESVPEEIRSHRAIMMGARVVSGWVELKAKVNFRESRIQKMLRDIELETPVARTLQAADKVGQWFLIFVFTIAALIVGWWWNIDTKEGFYRALSFIIVACPCTFASVIPLVFGLAMRKAARNGIFIKDPTVFERIGQIRKVFFDKTGVLTRGVFDVQTIEWTREPSNQDLTYIYLAVTQSDHPVSRAMARHFQEHFSLPVLAQRAQIKSLPGRGFEALLQDGTIVRVEKVEAYFLEKTKIPNVVSILINSERVATVILGDSLRAGSYEMIDRLQEKGYECWILSGDQESTVQNVAYQLHIPPVQAVGDLTFEDKARYLSQNPNSLMMGDGNNDALALKQSAIGISFQGGVESALRSSHVYFSGSDLKLVPIFFMTALSAHRMIGISLVISVLYNTVAGNLAIFGFVHPLLAALIMPVNAVTVFAVCQWVFRDKEGEWS